MSTGLLFIIGAIVFAITVYGAVMAGWVALSHAVDPESQMDPIIRRSGTEDRISPGSAKE